MSEPKIDLDIDPDMDPDLDDDGEEDLEQYTISEELLQDAELTSDEEWEALAPVNPKTP
jgi:hypothetical protein